MKRFQDLTLTGEPQDLAAFVEYVTANHGDWALERTLDMPDYLALGVPARVCPVASTLYLFQDRHNDRVTVTNILPVARHTELTVEQYNTILQAFHHEFIELAAPSSLRVELSPDSIFIENLLSPANMKLLMRFTRLANKNTGSTNPLDYRRWLAFISASARDQEILAPDVLQAWFIDQGWPSDIASTLVSEYRFGIDLIQQLSRESTEQDSISATR